MRPRSRPSINKAERRREGNSVRVVSLRVIAEHAIELLEDDKGFSAPPAPPGTSAPVENQRLVERSSEHNAIDMTLSDERES